ncbi:hypothetical protein [Rhodococcus sp. IEGM 1379]|uniref:hypothetical protein n=1 Tax=Rhodococcus sp. IEGM 1379 TaxID=3047086 RepID=UPI0024B73A81|nr:hypothetical protein [Rhodococcus sp. IEGM 1379]MDI9913866.1 hypothetical protein [Rhodococcus sp. IEGM 1379]
MHALDPMRMGGEVRPSGPHHGTATARTRLLRVPMRVRHAAVALSSGVVGLLAIRLRTEQGF